jgi:hypothetical protein
VTSQCHLACQFAADEAGNARDENICHGVPIYLAVATAFRPAGFTGAS